MASSTPFARLLMVIWLSMALPLCIPESRLFRIREDPRPIIPLDEFGYTCPGGLELIISRFSYSSLHPHPDLSYVGFFLWPRQSLTPLLRQLNNREIECPLRSDMVYKSALTFRYLQGTDTINMYRSIDEDENYTLLFANCVDGMNVSMNIESEMFNLIGRGDFGHRNYLSAGEKPLTRFYFLLFLAYFALTLIWTHLLLINHTKQHVVFGVHFLILAVLILKAMSLYCEAEKFSYINLHGFLGYRFKVVFYVLKSFMDSTIFSLILLISTTPWSIVLKPFPLSNKAKIIIFIIIPLQIIGNTAKRVVDETPPFTDDRFTWKVVFLVSDLVCCFAWLVINDLSFKYLKSQELVNKLQEIRLKEYCAVVKCYVFLTRVVLFAWDTSTMIMISYYKYLWITMVASEFFTLAFYVLMGFMFRPDPANKLMLLPFG